ncbi:MAG: CsbD family protein, partial [Rubrobacter sp.]|nr:CsbD family protein [Rubrobacter sp.]
GDESKKSEGKRDQNKGNVKDKKGKLKDLVD